MDKGKVKTGLYSCTGRIMTKPGEIRRIKPTAITSCKAVRSCYTDQILWLNSGRRS